jgi:hypothetical protein
MIGRFNFLEVETPKCLQDLSSYLTANVTFPLAIVVQAITLGKTTASGR